MGKKYFAVEQLAPSGGKRQADVYIFGDITPVEWLDGDVSANGVVGQIRGLDVDEIHVHIDSYGGSVSEGWAIYNALREHPAKIVTYGDGFVASAALFPFLAGDERHASSLSAYYMHEVSMGVYGYAKELRAAANEVDMMTDVGVKAFVQRAGMDENEVRELMAQETWLSPSDALERGIATDIIADSAPRHMQSAKSAFLQQFMTQKKTDEPQEPAKSDAAALQEAQPEEKPAGAEVTPLMKTLGGM